MPLLRPDPAPGLKLWATQPSTSCAGGVCHWPLGLMLALPPFLYCGGAALLGLPLFASITPRRRAAVRGEW